MFDFGMKEAIGDFVWIGWACNNRYTARLATALEVNLRASLCGTCQLGLRYTRKNFNLSEVSLETSI